MRETRKIPFEELGIEELSVEEPMRMLVPQQRYHESTPYYRAPTKRPLMKRGVSPLLYVGVAFCLVVALVWLFLWIAGGIRDLHDDLTYGKPRTFKIDAIVGHGKDPTTLSHFIVINQDQKVIIYECPANDPAHCKIYTPAASIVGPGSEKVPVTLSFKDVNGDGLPDMIIHVQFQDEQILVYINTGKEFRPATQNDKIRL